MLPNVVLQNSILPKMTQDEKWIARYNKVVTFIETNKRNPSKYDAEERGEYDTWLKQDRGDRYLFHGLTKSVIINS